MNTPFDLSITEVEGRRTITFANNSSDFVEVLFAIDGFETKEGKIPDASTKGYAYPPKLEKPVRKRKNGSLITLDSRGGLVQAYVFQGEGKYKDQDLEKPAFLRHRLVDKVSFRRTSDEPVAVLETRY